LILFKVCSSSLPSRYSLEQPLTGFRSSLAHTLPPTSAHLSPSTPREMRPRSGMSSTRTSSPNPPEHSSPHFYSAPCAPRSNTGAPLSTPRTTRPRRARPSSTRVVFLRSGPGPAPGPVFGPVRHRVWSAVLIFPGPDRWSGLRSLGQRPVQDQTGPVFSTRTLCIFKECVKRFSSIH
jgi:hypothetical protein